MNQRQMLQELLTSFGTAYTGGMPMKIRKGVIRKPPPTPNKPDSTPTAKLKNKRRKISIFT